jgi:DNA-binding XRE family transcriptional regulator
MPESNEPHLPYLRAWRIWRGLSQQELADLSGVSKTTIVHLEKGRATPHFVTVAKLATALNLTREQLLHTKPKRGMQ